jgi:hypothetical protein
MAKFRKDAGQALVIVAVSMVVLLGFMGLGMDLGYMRYMRRQVQMAADAAAIAGAKAIPSCVGVAGCSALTTAAQTAVSTDNSFPSVTQSTGCSPTPALGATVVLVNNPPTCLRANDPNTGNKYFVETIVARKVPTFFATMLGASSVTITARSEVQGLANCIYGLNSTPGAHALNLPFLDRVTAGCGIVSNADINNGFLTGLCGASVDLVGTASASMGFGLCSNGKAISPSPPTKIPKPVADPLSNLAAPTASAACNGSNAVPYPVAAGNLTVAPSTTKYCGGITIPAGLPPVTFSGGTYVIGGGTNQHYPTPGISIAAGANVTFNAGTYTVNGGITDAGSTVNFNASGASNPAIYILNGGGLVLGSGGFGGFGTTSTGAGVMFYNTGTGAGSCVTCYGPITSTFGNTTSMTAPATGTYAGILFFQDRNNPQAASFGTNFCFFFGCGGNTSTLQGGYYFPDAPVSFTFDFGTNAQYSFLVAKDITWAFSFTFNNNYSTLPGGVSPLPVGHAALIE